jgi:hypothetical protein
MGLKVNAMRKEETINTTALQEQIEGLRHMTVGQLKDRYLEVFGETAGLTLPVYPIGGTLA